MNVVFKDARFNGWSIGEVFAVDTRLIPNARRDNFEKNPSYFLFGRAAYDHCKVPLQKILEQHRLTVMLTYQMR